MVPDFYFDTTDYLIIIAIIIGISLTIAISGWFIGRIIPSLRFIAPLAIASFACWRATLEFQEFVQLAPFIIPFALSGIAVVIYRAKRP